MSKIQGGDPIAASAYARRSSPSSSVDRRATKERPSSDPTTTTSVASISADQTVAESSSSPSETRAVATFEPLQSGLMRNRRQLSVDDDPKGTERHQSTAFRPALPPLHRPSPPRPLTDRRQEKRKTVVLLSRQSYSVDAPSSPRCAVARRRSSPKKTDDIPLSLRHDDDDENPGSERTKTPVDGAPSAAAAAKTRLTQGRGQDGSSGGGGAVGGASVGRGQHQHQRLFLKDTGVRSSSLGDGAAVLRHFQYDYVQLVPGRQRTDNDRRDRSDVKRSFDEGVVVYLSTDDFLGSDCHETDIGQAVAVKPWHPSTGQRPMYDGPDLAPVDLPEDHLGTEVPILPLDVSRLQRIAGYEDTRYHGNSTSRAPLIVPPSSRFASAADDRTPEDRDATKAERIQEDFVTCASSLRITEEEARTILLRFVSERNCYGRVSAREMEIFDIASPNALHYTLETYRESRSTSWDQEPYSGQKIDGPGNGTAPLPWEIHCNPTQMFRSEIRFLEVPHTATISCCYGCSALGWNRCHSCYGRGFKRCISCCGSGRLWKLDAHGHRHVDSCWHCHGTGRKRCCCCEGDGRVTCKTCQGYRNLKCFIRLRVEYNNDVSERVIQKTELPSELIKTVTGTTVLEETQPKVWPITDLLEDELCNMSQEVHHQHLSRSRGSRILLQRQRLRVIHIFECSYTWVNSDGKFWIYGNEMAVYAPEYPRDTAGAASLCNRRPIDPMPQPANFSCIS